MERIRQPVPDSYGMESKMNDMNCWFQKKTIDLQRIKYSLIGVCLFYLAANGFVLFNYVPQHDSLNYVNKFSDSWEIQLGRFMLPIYGRIRGEITMPWLIGLISIACLIAVTYMLTELFEIKRPFMIIAAAAFLSANITHIELLSSFTYIEDACMLAAMLACFFVYILNRTNSRKWMALSIFVMTLSLGIYQAYISFAATLVLLLSVRKILVSGDFDRKDIRELLKNYLLLGLSCLVYFLLNKNVMMISGVQGVNDYHSLNGLLNDLGSLPSRFFVAYGSKFSMFFIRKKMDPGRIGNCLLAAAAVFTVSQLFRIKKVDLKSRVIFLILLFASTFTALMVNIGAGMVAYRLSFAVFLYYLFLISLVEMLLDSSEKTKRKVLSGGIFCCLFAMVIWSNIIFSNGAYTIQKVIFDRSISLYTRVMDDIYEIPEYVHNNTPMIILGDWTFDDYASDLAEKEYRDLGTFMNTSVTYRQTVGSLMRYLGEDVQLVQDEKVISEISKDPKVQDMPSFPTKGYCQMINGFLIINF